MKNLFCLALFALSALNSGAANSNPMKLWYDQPASMWIEALPLGNGRLGAMVYGNPVHEEIQLNEETVWGGSPYNNVNPKAKDALPEIRRLLFDGKYKEAQNLCGTTINSPRANGMPYQTVGSLKLDFDNIGEYSAYYRDLNIENAVATTVFKANGVTYTREVITSLPEQLVMVRLSASKPGALSFSARFTTPYKDAVRGVHKGMLRLDGKASDHEGIEGKVRFTSLLKAVTKGGKTQFAADTLMHVRNADEVTLYISIGTNFVNYKDVSGNALATAENYLKKAGKKTFEQSKKAHSAYHSALFKRVSLDLGENEQAQKPTNVRVHEFAKHFDPQLAALYFQFGRYLLICSSQPGGQPANLQGIWNYQLRAPWDGKYTSDINLEMNYWLAESTNLREMHEPLLQLIKDLSVTGKETAQMYGCRGWALHHNTDIWRMTGAVDGPRYGIWPTCNAWLCQHLWDRYLYLPNKGYLKEVYPIMKGACEFFLDFLVEEPTTGWLVVAPSYSPENIPPHQRKEDASISAGCTMDNQMVADLFANTISAAGVLNIDASFVAELQQTAARLAPPVQVGKHGQVQEWLFDWDSPKDRHRHISHLWGLYPGHQISPLSTPEWAKAAKTTLIQRGDPSTGWSMAWKVCLWARLLDGNHAYKLLTEQIKPVYEEKGQNGGTYPNLFDAHPPFQIDGNFGCAAGIAEMFVQNHNGIIHLLPALPDVWTSGTLKGLRCHGGFELVEMQWKNKQVTTLTIRSHVGGPLRIRVNASDQALTTKKGKTYTIRLAKA